MTLQDLSQNIIDKDYKEYDTIKKSVDLYSKILPSYPPKVSGGDTPMPGYDLFYQLFPNGDVSAIVENIETTCQSLLKFDCALFTFYKSLNVGS